MYQLRHSSFTPPRSWLRSVARVLGRILSFNGYTTAVVREHAGPASSLKGRFIFAYTCKLSSPACSRTRTMSYNVLPRVLDCSRARACCRSIFMAVYTGYYIAAASPQRRVSDITITKLSIPHTHPPQREASA
jgi:hypothetical protein